jgi:hypothetical protein
MKTEMKFNRQLIFILGLCAAINVQNAIAESWIEVGSSSKALYYIDTSSIRNPHKSLKANVRFNTMIELANPTEKGIKSIGLTIDYDCNSNLSYVVTTTLYRGSMGVSRVDSSSGGGLNFSINSRAREIICRH